MTFAVIFLAPIAAGIIQTVTGFGSGIFMMVFFPMLFPILNASAISSSISLAVSGPMSWRYRKQTAWKLLLLPTVIYIATSSASIVLAPYLPTEALKKFFGFFLIVLSIYFLTVAGKLKIKASLSSAMVCGTLSGIVGGLFGIGGPPMVIYFLAALDDKEKYLGTIQTFFFLTGIWTLAFRVINGIYRMDMIPYTLIGLAGMLIGTRIGVRIIDRINADTMRKLVYAFLGFAGLVNML